MSFVLAVDYKGKNCELKVRKKLRTEIFYNIGLEMYKNPYVFKTVRRF